MTSKIGRGLPALFTILLLATVTFGQDPNSGTPAVQCPAPLKYVDTFQKAKCVEVTLRYDLKLTRVFSNDNASRGTYFTTTCLVSPRYAIRKLALKQEWGNRATKMVEVTVPAGTTIYIGIAAFQNPEILYPGGAQQTVVVDLSKLVWGTPRRFISERCGSGGRP
jgi:hypothetical protein